jgi:hypothetical protein
MHKVCNCLECDRLRQKSVPACIKSTVLTFAYASYAPGNKGAGQARRVHIKHRRVALYQHGGGGGVVRRQRAVRWIRGDGQ